jgi:hypothetical protein
MNILWHFQLRTSHFKKCHFKYLIIVSSIIAATNCPARELSEHFISWLQYLENSKKMDSTLLKNNEYQKALKNKMFIRAL